MLVLKHLKIEENVKWCLPERKWQRVLLKMGFLRPKNSKDEKLWNKNKIFILKINFFKDVHDDGYNNTWGLKMSIGG